MKKQAGRNFRGVITVRHRGGGEKRKLRMIDFKRDKEGIPGRVAAIEYDPNRSARIALIYYADGEKRYILAPLELNVGDTVMSGGNAEIKPGNALPMKSIPAGTQIHNIEMQKGQGRADGTECRGISSTDGQGRRIRPDPVCRPARSGVSAANARPLSGR